jgi:hypothetical protein
MRNLLHKSVRGVQAFDAAAGIVGQLISLANGTAPGPMLASGNVAPTAKLYSLASIIAAIGSDCAGLAGMRSLHLAPSICRDF